MTGLFGGGSQQTYVEPQPTVNKEAEQKSAREKNERRKSYGQDAQFKQNNLLTGADTTLSSGSLLSLGGTLG